VARILVADDNEQFVHMLCATLEDAGHEVLTASTGLAVTDLLDREVFDLLVLDVLMPGMSGDAIAARVGRAIPAILMTGDSGGQFAPPGVPLLRKPFSEQQLLDAVDAAL
jgi:two-component system, cell cycle response regulator CpdR